MNTNLDINGYEEIIPQSVNIFSLVHGFCGRMDGTSRSFIYVLTKRAIIIPKTIAGYEMKKACGDIVKACLPKSKNAYLGALPALC